MSGVSIVIVSFNAREYLERCLDAVAGGVHEVVVVDNASEDASPALVRERFPSVRLIELPQNVGFGAATNPNFLSLTDNNPTSATAGQLITTNIPGAPRQVQLGVRFQF